MNIHTDFEAIKSVALHYAKEHGVNYNVILQNPVNGEFGSGSTYEFVQDSYFEKERDCILLYKTDDELTSENDLDYNILNNNPYLSTAKTYLYENSYAFMQNNKPQVVRPNYDHIKTGLGHKRNDPCECGSGKKFKKCCLNK